MNLRAQHLVIPRQACKSVQGSLRNASYPTIFEKRGSADLPNNFIELKSRSAWSHANGLRSTTGLNCNGCSD